MAIKQGFQKIQLVILQEFFINVVFYTLCDFLRTAKLSVRVSTNVTDWVKTDLAFDVPTLEFAICTGPYSKNIHLALTYFDAPHGKEFLAIEPFFYYLFVKKRHT